MLARALWFTPPLAAILALQPSPQLTTIESENQHVRIVACVAERGVFPLPRVMASDRNLERYEQDEPICVEVTPALPWGWDFGAEVPQASVDRRP
jgi:hypothetical protein